VALPFSVVNKALKKKEISRLINTSSGRCGLRDTVIMADKLMSTGFTFATRAGISIAWMIARAQQKNELIAAAEKEVHEIDTQYTSGLVTQGERYNKVVDYGAVPVSCGQGHDWINWVVKPVLSMQLANSTTVKARW